MSMQPGSEQQFLHQRRAFIAAWRSIGPLLIAGLLIFIAMLLFAAPMFLNPFAVIARLRTGTLDLTTLQTMAMMLPVAVVLLCTALLLLIFQTYRNCRREQQYLALIEQRP